MKHIKTIQFLLLLAVLTAACSTPAVPTSVAVPVAAATSYSDPAAYCAAVGTIDTPDARYTGAKVPDAVAQSIKQASGAATDAPLNMFVSGSAWRCVNGKVYGCFVGANIPCNAKANIDKTPTADETEFCKANTNADVIPAVVTGRETVYEWRCTNGAPAIVRQVLTPDAQGFISSFWYELKP